MLRLSKKADYALIAMMNRSVSAALAGKNVDDV